MTPAGRPPSPLAPCGGMSALIAAAKAEGHLTVTTDPDTWANYGHLIAGFEKQYGIKILDTNPNGTSADEINEINLDKGNPSSSPTCSTSASPSPSRP